MSHWLVHLVMMGRYSQGSRVFSCCDNPSHYSHSNVNGSLPELPHSQPDCLLWICMPTLETCKQPDANPTAEPRSRLPLMQVLVLFWRARTTVPGFQGCHKGCICVVENTEQVHRSYT